MRANWERHLLGLTIRVLLIQLPDKCLLGLYSTVVLSGPFDLPKGCMNMWDRVVFAFYMNLCILTALDLFCLKFIGKVKLKCD